MFRSAPDLELGLNSFEESRSRLVDARGTLTLITDDISFGRESVSSQCYGASSEQIRALLISLKNSVNEMIELINDWTQENDTVDYVDGAYSAPAVRRQCGPGRSRILVTRDQIEHLRSLHFSWEKIAKLLNVSTKTLKRRREEYGLSEKFEIYSSISDEDLNAIYRNLVSDNSTGFLTPNLGRRRFIGALRSRGLRVQRSRVSDCIKSIDPIGTALRWRLVIHRRKYYVPAPNSLWHIDSAHKLIKYKLVVHVCIDGKTRLLVYCVCCNNNKAETVLSLFERGVQLWDLPSRVRSDYGMENYLVGAYMIEHRGPNRGSIITGSSVHNSRVERSHRDIFSGVLVFYAQVFEDMEESGILDPLNDIHLHCLHRVYSQNKQIP